MNDNGGSDVDRTSLLTTPLSQRGVPVWLIYSLAIIGVIYNLNPTFGLLELIPDNLPLFGNLDEGAAFAMIWYGLLELLHGSGLGRKP